MAKKVFPSRRRRIRIMRELTNDGDFQRFWWTDFHKKSTNKLSVAKNVSKAYTLIMWSMIILQTFRSRAKIGYWDMIVIKISPFWGKLKIDFSRLQIIFSIFPHSRSSWMRMMDGNSQWGKAKFKMIPSTSWAFFLIWSDHRGWIDTIESRDESNFEIWVLIAEIYSLYKNRRHFKTLTGAEAVKETPNDFVSLCSFSTPKNSSICERSC